MLKISFSHWSGGYTCDSGKGGSIPLILVSNSSSKEKGRDMVEADYMAFFGEI